LRRWCVTASVYTAIFLAAIALTGCGGSASSTQSTQVTPANGGSSGSIPSGATIIDNVEDTPNWLTCGACGNDGAVGSIAVNSFTPGISSPSEDGRATQFSIAASTPYTNTYWYQQQTPIRNQIGFLMYEFDLYIPAGSENAPQAVEFECQQILGGWVYNFSWQAIYTLNVWRIFNYGAKQWESANIPFQHFSPGTWHHIVAEYHNDLASHSVFHDALTVDGVRYPLNIRHDAFFSGSNDQFTNAIQLDSNLHPDPYSVVVDKMRIAYK